MVATACALVAANVGVTAAQAPPARGLALEAGAVVHGQSDAAASPLRYTGAGGVLAVAWLAPGRDSRLEIRAEVGRGRLRSALAPSAGLPVEELWVARVGGRYLRRVRTLAEGRVVILAGADLTAHASFREHNYPVDRTELYADLLAPLSLAGGWEWDAGPLRAGGRLTVPVAGVSVRTPWGGLKYAPPVRLEGPTGLTGFGHELFVDAVATGFLDVRATWSLTVLHHDDPRPLDTATHRFVVSGILHRRRW